MLGAFSQTVEDVAENARANLEYIDMKFGAPVYIGDTLEVETKVLGVRISKSRPNLGVVHVQSTARKNIGSDTEAIVATWQRKVQVYKGDDDVVVENFDVAPDTIECELFIPPYDPNAKLADMAHLTSADSYLEDLEVGSRIEHSRACSVCCFTRSVSLRAMRGSRLEQWAHSTNGYSSMSVFGQTRRLELGTQQDLLKESMFVFEGDFSSAYEDIYGERIDFFYLEFLRSVGLPYYGKGGAPHDSRSHWAAFESFCEPFHGPRD